MKPIRLILFCLSVLAIGKIYAQERLSVPNSLNPGHSFSETNASIQSKHHKKRIKFFSPHRAAAYRRPNVKHTARYEFYERVERAAKEKQRILKELSKRQYSDSRYFGHKKIPKRRPPHKMRYCEECGIRH